MRYADQIADDQILPGISFDRKETDGVANGGEKPILSNSLSSNPRGRDIFSVPTAKPEHNTASLPTLVSTSNTTDGGDESRDVDVPPASTSDSSSSSSSRNNNQGQEQDQSRNEIQGASPSPHQNDSEKQKQGLEQETEQQHTVRFMVVCAGLTELRK